MQSKEKIPLTDQMRTRMKELQANPPKNTNLSGKKRLKDSDIAAAIGISVNKYKNIVNPAHNKTVESSILRHLAQFYDCSYDYLLGLSDDIELDRNGHRLIHPISENEFEKEIMEVNKFLSSNRSTLHILYIMLIEFPADLRAHILSALDSYSKIIQITTFIGRKDSMNSDNFNYIWNILKEDRPELTQLAIDLAQADYDFGKKRYNKALEQYLKIIYYASPSTASVADKAVDKVTHLHKKWKSFPKELSSLVKQSFPILKSEKYLLATDIAKQTDTILCEYFKTHNIEYTNRKEYFESFY